MIINKEKINKICFPNIRHEDFAFFLDILKNNNEKSVRIDEVIGGYRVQEKSISSNKLKSALWTWKIYREYEKLNLVKSCYYFINYALRGIKKYKKKG